MYIVFFLFLRKNFFRGSLGFKIRNVSYYRYILNRWKMRLKIKINLEIIRFIGDVFFYIKGFILGFFLIVFRVILNKWWL